MAPKKPSTTSKALRQYYQLGPMNPRGALGLLAAILAVGLVGWIFLSQASATAETERRIQKLRQQKEEIQRQNDQLAYDIARLASVERLEKRARELGYVPVSEAHFLAVANYPIHTPDTAKAKKIPSWTNPTKRTTPSAVAGWWESVTDQFDVWSQIPQP